MPERELVTPTKWRKLPKGWCYGTRLFEETYNEEEEENKAREARSNVKISDKEGIKELIKNGHLVPFEENDHCFFETQIGKEGWRIIRRYDDKVNLSGVFTKQPYEIYSTYEEANAEAKAYRAELLRISNLSDYDWSVEQIDKDIARIVNATPEEWEGYRKFLLSQDNVEDIETRIFGGKLQWKYCKNKRWMGIEL